MKFGNFTILISLIWIVPALVVFYVLALKRSKDIIQRFAQKELLPDIAPLYEVRRRMICILLNISAVFLLILALARPQWGFYWKQDICKGADMIFAVDVSRSMLATDMSPDRLSFTKKQLRDFVRKLKGDRIGLIAFAGEAFLQCPLTSDYRGFLIALDDINTETIPRGGTSIASAIEEAIRSYSGAGTENKVMIIITDGENTAGDIHKIMDKAEEEKIMICCIGVGTENGEAILATNHEGKRQYIKDKDGNIVRSRLMEAILDNLAKDTGGIYVKATQYDSGLDDIYNKRLSKIEKKSRESEKVKVYKEKFQLPLSLAFICLLIEFVLSRRFFAVNG